MKMSTANLTTGQIERWRAKGYIVDVDADNESVDVSKPNPDAPRLEYWHDKEESL